MTVRPSRTSLEGRLEGVSAPRNACPSLGRAPGQVRDLENGFYEKLCASAATLLERAAATAEADDGGGFSDEARAVLADKDGFNNALQASHDSHLTAIDGAEDRLVSEETRRYATLLGDTRAWEVARNRDRISEVLGLVDRWRAKAEALLAALEQVEE